MAGIIMAHEGVLLRFIGDGILAVFGVPVPRRDRAGIADDARRAARCALAMEQAMGRLNDDWRAEGLPEAGLRIGIHTGPLVAGSLGTGSAHGILPAGRYRQCRRAARAARQGIHGERRRYCTIVVGGPTFDLLDGACPDYVSARSPCAASARRWRCYRIDSEAAAQVAGELQAEAVT